MAANARSDGSGVEVVLDSLDQPDKPVCPHGPTILFERFCNNNRKRFYACSSCRDRKQCSFYQNEEDYVLESTMKTREEILAEFSKSLFKMEDYKRYEEALKASTENRKFCRRCQLLLTKREFSAHLDHPLISGITTEQMQTPTRLLVPLENNKANAQYLFSEKTQRFLIDQISHLGYTHVLCIGVPRIHEGLRKQKSLLLDIDSRFHQFYDMSNFCHYNMFNHHFFGGPSALAEYKSFLQSAEPGHLLVIIDPPFGGLVDLIVHTLKRIAEDLSMAHGRVEDQFHDRLEMFWFFPYFMEPRVCQARSDLVMLDYKVDYANHESFKDGPKGRKQGSPVRIFTNVDPSQIMLPADEGYRFCDLCKKYVSSENRHCKICKACTSKDGKTYVHCDVCERCVKPSRVHCFKCELCLPPNHHCGQTLGAGCHLCGDLSHKRRDCPLKDKPGGVYPRKRTQPQNQCEDTKKKKMSKPPKNAKKKRKVKKT